MAKENFVNQNPYLILKTSNVKFLHKVVVPGGGSEGRADDPGEGEETCEVLRRAVSSPPPIFRNLN